MSLGESGDDRPGDVGEGVGEDVIVDVVDVVMPLVGSEEVDERVVMLDVDEVVEVAEGVTPTVVRAWG